MLVVQFAASAMLFPFLLRDARHCLAVMLTALPMLQLAAVLSGTSTARLVGAWTCVALWLTALTLWRPLLTDRRRGFAIAMTNLLAAGGLVFWYLAAEFAVNDRSFVRFFPAVATLRFAHGAAPLVHPLFSTAVLAGTGLLAQLLMRPCAPRRS